MPLCFHAGCREQGPSLLLCYPLCGRWARATLGHCRVDIRRALNAQTHVNADVHAHTVHTRTHVYTHAQTRAQRHKTHVHTCAHSQTRTHGHMDTYIYAETGTCAHMHTETHTHAHVDTHTQTRAHRSTHTDAHVHTWTQYTCAQRHRRAHTQTHGHTNTCTHTRAHTKCPCGHRRAHTCTQTQYTHGHTRSQMHVNTDAHVHAHRPPGGAYLVQGLETVAAPVNPPPIASVKPRPHQEHRDSFPSSSGEVTVPFLPFSCS